MTEVSSITGNTQQAAAEATTARQATKVAWQDSLVTHLVIGLILLAIAYILLYNLEWTFFWKILLGAGIFYAAGKLGTSKLAWHWPRILRGIGLGIILLTVLQSGFVKLVAKGIDKLEVRTTEVAENGFASTTPAETAVYYAPVDRKVYGYIAPIVLEPGQESIAITDFLGSCIYWDVTGGPNPTLLSADENNVWMVGWKQGQHQIRFRNDSEAAVVISPERRIGASSCL